MMAASMPGPLSFNSQIPVTPPPDHQMFMKGLFPPNAFQQPGHHNHNHNHQHHAQPPQQNRYGSVGLGLHEPTPSNSTTSGLHIKSEAEPSKLTSPRQQPMQPPPQLRTSTTTPNIPPNFKPPFPTSSLSQPPTTGTGTNTNTPLDPHYLAMASRIASYYQQRCTAIANYQHHRCQQWASAQRAKSQEMTQAAMLVVAWYIRDRINRRRRRQKKSFKRALSSKNHQKAKVTKGETVRRWVMGVPLKTESDFGGRELPMDEQERNFDVDGVVEEEDGGKDGRLFEVADGLIKSQLARIE
ncbi:hypothetical protein QBC40DRAFT_50683 [Triangularia verruculosa]|uniref:Uncharacterized protein n=1 Tax=Triangularia verruculosa TaxID=2587418 RepID=A0AAN6XQZ0_9PEZI|nr:hypothetical protein QBC40DRAFT_50683 [Triangularia verruculosa]